MKPWLRQWHHSFPPSSAAMEGSSFNRLEQVASKQSEWRALNASSKAELLEEMLDIVQSIGFEGYKEASQDAVEHVMRMSLDTTQGRLETAMQTLVLIAMVKSALEGYHYAYQVRSGLTEPLAIPNRTTLDGQVVLQVSPLTTADKFGPFAKCIGELYLDPDRVPDENAIQTFDFDYFQSDNKDDGVALILGAGNQTFLTFIDALYALFQTNRVAYIKHHPLRSHLDGIFRRIFAPLIERHYLDTEIDSGVERSKLLVCSPLVSHVHMTGGKATHDAIVWGSTVPTTIKQEPILKATVTSELGCITPWIIVPGNYTSNQLRHQASTIAKAVHSNASANCNAPKVLVLSQVWPQREEFLDMIQQEWINHVPPHVWYSGSMERWQAYRKAYPDADLVESNVGPSDGPQVLPLLLIHVKVTMSTLEGRRAVTSEYCFAKEPFAPVLAIAAVQDETFLESAVELCNEYIFGSLSCSITVPIELQGSKQVETAISKLKYGVVGVNSWTGFAYGIMPLTWGAFPGESLEHVQSGIGQVKNTYFVPHVQKSVFRTHLVDKIHGEMEKNLSQSIREAEVTARFVLHPGIRTFVKLIAASIGIHLPFVSDSGGECGGKKNECLVSKSTVGVIFVAAAAVLYLEETR